MKKIVLSLIAAVPSVILSKSQDYHLAMVGHYQLAQNNPQQSLESYQKLLGSSQSLYPYGGYVRFLFATGNYRHIVALMPRLEQTFADDLDMQLIFAQALSESGRQQEADKRVMALQEKYKKNTELTYLAAQAFAKVDPKKAVMVIDEFLNTTQSPKKCLFLFMQSQYYNQLNNKEKAMTAIQKSLDLCPRFDKGWLVLGMLHEQEGKINEAISGYKNYLQLAGRDPKVEQQINHLLLRSKLQPAQQPTPQVNRHLLQAQAFCQKQEYVHALQEIDLALVQMPAHEETKLLKINILSAQNNIDAATRQLTTWMCDEPANAAWYNALRLLHKAGLTHEKTIAILQAVEQKHPQELELILNLADLHTRARNFKQALAYHEKALGIAADAALKTKILFNRGVIEYETQQFDAMKKTLELALQYDQSCAPLHNLLAYYYATYGRDLNAAQKHITQALALDAHNPHFLDTQATIWYKQRDYTKAANALKKLAAQQPKDYYIHLHLAKTYEKLGNQKLSKAELTTALNCSRTEQERNACKRMMKVLEG